MKRIDDDRYDPLGTVFHGLDKIFNIVSDMVENDKDELNVDGTFNPKGNRDVVGKYGFNIKIGDSVIKSSDRNHTAKRQGPKSVEPVTDMYEEEDRVLFVIELPGVLQENIRLQTGENFIQVSATGNKVLYEKKINLEFEPMVQNIKTTFSNAIYAIEIKKEPKS